MADIIQIIANEEEVRDMIFSITGQDYSQEKITSGLKYGSALVATKTGIYVWNESNVWYHVGVQAANYLAASNIVPKNFRDPDTGKSYSMTLYESGLRDISTINEGAVNDPNAGTEDEGGGFIQIISSLSKNYYRNKEAKPF